MFTNEYFHNGRVNFGVIKYSSCKFIILIAELKQVLKIIRSEANIIRSVPVAELNRIQLLNTDDNANFTGSMMMYCSGRRIYTSAEYKNSYGSMKV
ncbi:hypothetical protein AY601_2029 [Pedobacter cryoconitis]|uniref:Uncharacterized protein n=1 Tax=Pedobacter cryoconitis TaxID=188932 RepID=A0A127VC55_9SPHI|nr:hypothetical protein AY601_2029 [Pedobacter cryoconitis]